MKTTLCIMLTAIGISLNGQNLEITPENGKSFLLGKLSLEAFAHESYKSWYAQGYKDYEVDDRLVNQFTDTLAQCRLQLFLGTWCGDSRREVPRIIKILEEARFPMERLDIIALDRRKGWYKRSPGGEEQGKNIIKVPTLVFLMDGKEINRIVESPKKSLEKDMEAILNGNSYIPNYADNRP
ncbi:MAG: thioredoxin family protein [Bacteroidota bacterium]